MQRYRRLLIGVDVLDYGRTISQGSQAAIRQARWLAERTGASLTLLYSHYRRPSTPMFERQAIEDLIRSMKSDGIDAGIAVVEDRPSDEMVALAEAGQADLIFVGKRNRHEGAATSLGNVARKLMRSSPVPVWAVDPYARSITSVMAAHDLREVGGRAAQLASDVATLAECPLHVVHAWKVPMSLQMRDGRIPSQHYRSEEQAVADGVLAKLGEAMKGVQSTQPPQLHEGCGPASTVILEAVDRLDASLLVMGTLARSGIAGLLIGNTAEKFLDQAGCSLLTVKPHDFVVPPTDERRHTTMVVRQVAPDDPTDGDE